MGYRPRRRAASQYGETSDAVEARAELARLRPIFVEDPIPPDSVMALRAFAARVGLPVAAGERNTTIWEFAEYLERPGVAFVRPDVGIAGGITHVKKICALAEAFHAGVLPHAVPSGPVAVAAHVQLGMCVPNWELQEHVPQDEPRFADLVDHVIELRDGYLLAPDRPGIGIDLVDAGLARYPPVAVDLSDPPLARGRLPWPFDERAGEGTSSASRTRLQRGDPSAVYRCGRPRSAETRWPISPTPRSPNPPIQDGPVPSDRVAEAELGRFAADLDALIVCHGAPFVSAQVLGAASRLSLLGDLEGDRFGDRLDLGNAYRLRVASASSDTTHGSSWPTAEWALGLALIGLRSAPASSSATMVAHEPSVPHAERSRPGFDTLGTGGASPRGHGRPSATSHVA